MALVLAANIGMAQDKAFKDDVKKIILATGLSAQIDVAKKQVLTMVPAEKQAEFLKAFDSTLPAYFDKIEKYYTTEYTHDEIKQMVKFYETPTGKKFAQNAEKLANANMEAVQAWSQELQGVMMTFIQN